MDRWRFVMTFLMAAIIPLMIGLVFALGIEASDDNNLTHRVQQLEQQHKAFCVFMTQPLAQTIQANTGLPSIGC